MKKSVLILLIIVILTVIALYFGFQDKEKNSIEPLTAQLNTPAIAKVLVNNKNATKKTDFDENETIDESVYNPYESSLLKAQVQQIADLYEDTAKYPLGSQPIKNVADARLPEPFEETGVETPFETESGEKITLSAAVDKFQYYSGDQIQVRLNLNGAKAGAFITVAAVLAGSSGDTSLETDLIANDASQTNFTGVFDTTIAPPNTFSTEMIVKLLVGVDGEAFFTTVAFRYNVASARLTSLGFVRANGPNMDIPLEYSVFTSGYYFVSAVLFDAQTDQPLIALQTEGRMTQGNGRLLMQAHIQALQEVGSEGPYVLKNIKAYRGAERGEQFDQPATSLKSEFGINAIPFSGYENDSYQDPLAQERIEFLRNIGTLNETEDLDEGGE